MTTLIQLSRVQGLVDIEGEKRIELARAEREACEASNTSARARVMQDIAVCDGRTQALALLSMYLFTALHLCQDQIEEQKYNPINNNQIPDEKQSTERPEERLL